MPTVRFDIKDVARSGPIAIVGPDDFVLGEGQEFEPEVVLRDPRFSLYCVDRENGSARFVEVDDPAAVDEAPFYYQAQAEHAVGLVSMPLEQFHLLAHEIPEPSDGLILVHSVGRCGSTLVSKVLDAVPRVYSLSEPDDLTQAARLWVADGHDDVWFRSYLASSLRWRGKARVGGVFDRLAIKTRSEVFVLGEFLGSLCPRAKHLFLYRDAVSWMGSIFRGWNADRDPYDDELNRKMMASWSGSIPLVRQAAIDDLSLNQVEIRMLSWVTCMEAYFGLRRQCVPLCAIRYEDIVRDPGSIVEEILSFCEIECVDWHSVQAVLDRDSQAGTIYDREVRGKLTRKLTPELVEDIRRLVAARPLLGTTDVILPGTVGLQ